VRGAIVAIALFVVPAVAAQARGRSPALELRMDGILARRSTMTHIALGVTRPMSRNVELQLVVGGGATVRDDDDPRASARADLLARFAPAPVSVTSWGAYASAGVGALVERKREGRAVLVLLLGVRKGDGFFEAGLGGGVRLGIGVRL
jgi:hypothetical protein